MLQTNIHMIFLFLLVSLQVIHTCSDKTNDFILLINVLSYFILKFILLKYLLI